MLLASFQCNSLLKGPVSKYNHILRHWEGGLQCGDMGAQFGPSQAECGGHGGKKDQREPGRRERMVWQCSGSS